MKKLLIIFPVLILMLFVFISFINKNNFMKIKETNSSPGFALVELFTSEGCSSCPPADALLERVSKEYKSNVYVLGFHVDYWNQLGWKDIYSNADFTNRQKQYAALFNLTSIYTPEIVVNGKTEFVGSDENKLRKTIQQELNIKNASTISLDVKNNDNKSIIVDYKVSSTNNDIMHFALVQLHAETDVKRGENGGRKLQHINIVRDFKTATTNSGNINLLMPAGMFAKDFKVIAFVQNKNDLKITCAAEKMLQ
jgi:hypothetical protein